MLSDLRSISTEKPLGGQGRFLFHTAVNSTHVVLEITAVSYISRLQVFSDLPRHYLPHISACGLFSPAQATFLAVNIKQIASPSHMMLQAL